MHTLHVRQFLANQRDVRGFVHELQFFVSDTARMDWVKGLREARLFQGVSNKDQALGPFRMAGIARQMPQINVVVEQSGRLGNWHCLGPGKSGWPRLAK